jgi:hypothetical protein
MCIPHGGGSVSNGYEKEVKPKKHISRVSKEEFEKGDPNFVDERVSIETVEKKKSFLEKLIQELAG